MYGGEDAGILGDQLAYTLSEGPFSNSGMLCLRQGLPGEMIPPFPLLSSLPFGSPRFHSGDTSDLDSTFLQSSFPLR